MPAVLAPLVGLLIGFAFHLGGSRQLLRAAPGTAVETRAQLLLLAYTLILFMPFCAYFLAFAPDWSFFYLVDAASHWGPLALASVLVDTGSVVFGFHLARRYFRTRPGSAFLWVLVPTVALVLVLSALGRKRLTVDATYEQFQGAFGVQPVAGSALGYSLLWLGSIFLGGTVLTALQFRRLGE